MSELVQGKNYITPQGFKRLEEEIKRLRFKERPEITAMVAWAASNGDRSENGDYIYGKKRLREIDRRIEYLSKRLDAAEIVDPTGTNANEVRFGATVTLLDEEGGEKVFAIVGSDEVDVSQGKISWLSPLGAALLRAKAKEGDWVTFQSPKGEQAVQVLKIEYKPVE